MKDDCSLVEREECTLVPEEKCEEVEQEVLFQNPQNLIQISWKKKQKYLIKIS